MSMNPFIARGICPDCESHPLQHGPWNEAEVQEVAHDIGCEPAEFTDCCDDCFLEHVAVGDEAYAQKLAGRPLVLASSGLSVQPFEIAKDEEVGP